MAASLHLTIAPGDDAPIYRQIVRQVREAIAAGRVATGDRLPSQRELAGRLVVAPLTVKKAYDELEREGLIRTARGQGTFVAAADAARGGEERLEALRRTARRLVHEAQLAGLEPAAVVALLQEEHERLVEERGRSLSAERPS